MRKAVRSEVGSLVLGVVAIFVGMAMSPPQDPPKLPSVDESRLDEPARSIVWLRDLDVQALSSPPEDGQVGVSRLVVAKTLPSGHTIMTTFKKHPSMQRYLVGNGVQPFSRRDFRIQSPSIDTGSTNARHDKPLLSAEEVAKLLPTHYGVRRTWPDGAKRWLTTAPVIAQKSCLSCHTRNREGDVLGQLFYAVK